MTSFQMKKVSPSEENDVIPVPVLPHPRHESGQDHGGDQNQEAGQNVVDLPTDVGVVDQHAVVGKGVGGSRRRLAYFRTVGLVVMISAFVLGTVMVVVMISTPQQLKQPSNHRYTPNGTSRPDTPTPGSNRGQQPSPHSLSPPPPRQYKFVVMST